MRKRLALIIGTSLYRDTTLARLTAPEADVGAFADALLDGEMGGFDDVKQLVNMASHTVRREISEFFSRKSRDDMLLFYFSGHGVLDDRGRLYLALKDTDTKLLRGTAIPANYITDEMDNSRSQRQVLILDCCHSGAFARGSKSATGASVGTASTFEGAGFGRVVLTASDATQYAWEGNQIIGEAENSLFTHFLVQGIQTGEADANKDGKITIDEIYDYAYTRILQETPKQTPGKWSFKEQGELILSRSPVVEQIVEEEEPEPESTEETQEVQLDKLYTGGLSALLAENWGKAIETFELILKMQPGYLDADQKLAHAKLQKKLDDLYTQAISKYEAGNLDESIQLLEDLLSQDPEYKNADDKLEKYRQEKKLADNYTNARQSFESGKYEAVVKTIGDIRALSPDFEDSEGLLEKAQAQIEARKQKKGLEERYKKAALAMESGNLEDARKLINQIREEDPTYKDTEELLARVDAMIAADVEGAATLPQQEIVHSHPLEEKPTLAGRIAAFPKWVWGVAAAGILGAVGLVVVLVIVFGNLFPADNGPVPEAIRENNGDQVGQGEDQIVAPQQQEDEVAQQDQSDQIQQGGLDEVIYNPVDGAELVLVPAGEFSMGESPDFGLKYCEDTLGEGICTIDNFTDEAPVHPVYLDNFYIYLTEVTNAQYADFLTQVGNQQEDGALWYGVENGFGDLTSDKGSWYADPNYFDDPVVEVTWYGAAAYCEWAGGRLPTEAEWEKAAKGETNYVFPWGDQFDSNLANVDDEKENDEDTIECSPSGCDGYVDTAPVGSFPGGASPYGVLDMAGNVWEWVSDWYDEDYYSYSPHENPTGPANGDLKIRRGGSWWSYDLNVRIANRGPVKPTDADITLGFRCVFDE